MTEVKVQDLRAKFPEINMSQFAIMHDINPSAMRRYVSDTDKPLYISEERLKLINEGLHRLGKVLLETTIIK